MQVFNCAEKVQINVMPMRCQVGHVDDAFGPGVCVHFACSNDGAEPSVQEGNPCDRSFSQSVQLSMSPQPPDNTQHRPPRGGTNGDGTPIDRETVCIDNSAHVRGVCVPLPAETTLDTPL
jgi:hypothetical protein